ncbi:cysteine hydrolase [Collinsella sp. zg1085]|uniref:cysteine hydrolase family protein n=1 Tax=Collinsella sp. zg1085 TaxID=2844380 RepID=UPI001C0D9B7F|nr:isochorismatase family cysteine hydrolase [Collinsella sp. zg1085]QWT17945.1 cysteine hydrolase [Collinsella sp. zg1085]
MSNSYLVVIDMQNDFVTGSMGSAAAVAIADQVVAYAQSYPGTLVFTQDTHDEHYSETQEGRRLPIKHCIANTEGWQLIPALARLQAERKVRVFEKPTFGSIALADWLAQEHRKQAIDRIELCGVATDICVASNALLIKASLPEVPLVVWGNLCAGTNAKNHQAALSTMLSCQVDCLINELGATASN